jgi:hypothetical protein
MKKFLATVAVLTVVATPALAQVSAQRAAAIEKCTQLANSEYGPSGDTSWRRFNNDAYATCMTDAGQLP